MRFDDDFHESSPTTVVTAESCPHSSNVLLSRQTWLILVGVVITAIAVIVPIALTSGQEAQQSIRNLSIVGLATAAGISSIVAVIRTRMGHAYRQILAVFSLGILCWLAAEAIWNYYFFVLGIDVPYPSLADIFYLAAYPPVGYFLYRGNKILSGRVHEEDNLIATSITITVVAFIVNVFLVEIIQSSLGFSGMTADDITILILSISYPVLDGLLLVPVIMILYNALRNHIRSFTWTLLAASFLVTVVADTGFGYSALIGLQEVADNPVWDILYAFLYILVAAAMVNEMFAGKEKVKASATMEESRNSADH